jgi:hypothetical protein
LISFRDIAPATDNEIDNPIRIDHEKYHKRKQMIFSQLDYFIFIEPKQYEKEYESKKPG